MEDFSIDVEEELYALQAIYEESLELLRSYPPHVAVALRPCTGEDASVQFVQATLILEASEKYPEGKLRISLRDVKGLGDERRDALLSHLRLWVQDQTTGPLLVTACEEAKDRLTLMNEPDGDCCFCINPVVGNPYMKLMNCFHCFHTEKKEKDPRKVKCPICRTEITDDDVAQLTQRSAERHLLSDQEEERERAVTGSCVEIAHEARTAEEDFRRASYALLYAKQEAMGGIIVSKRPPQIPTPPESVPISAPVSESVSKSVSVSESAPESVQSEPSTQRNVDAVTAFERFSENGFVCARANVNSLANGFQDRGERRGMPLFERLRELNQLEEGEENEEVEKESDGNVFPFSQSTFGHHGQTRNINKNRVVRVEGGGNFRGGTRRNGATRVQN